MYMINLKRKNLFNLKPKGFTLIELLVVISIIGVLSSTIYAPFNEARKKGRDTKRVAEISSIQKSLSLFSDDHSGCFPVDKKNTNYNNILAVDNYKYISKDLYDKLADVSNLGWSLTGGRLPNGSVKFVTSITPHNKNTPYYFISVGNGDCLSSPANNTDYSNMYFSYYQLFTELETHATALDSDNDNIVLISGTYRSSIRFDLFGYKELCVEDTAEKLDCTYDISNF